MARQTQIRLLGGGGKVGSIYRGGKAEDIIQAAKSVTLPDGYTLWLYVPDSNAGGGNLQNTVNATFGPSTPPKKVQAQFQLKKVLEGEGAPALKEGQFTFNVTGPDGYSAQVTNKADGTIEGPVLEFTANQLWSDGQRTFEYTIQEVEGNDPKIEYDDLKVNVNVNVQKGNDGELYVNIWGEPIANSLDNEDTPGMFQTPLATFTNKYDKTASGPEITNTTVTLNGNVEATSSEAAKYTAQATENIDVTLTDKVEYEGLDSSKTYTITSTVNNDKGSTVDTKDTTISGKTDGIETVSFDNLTSTGEYYIKTELKDSTGAVIFTHNGDLNLKEEMAIIEKDGEVPTPGIKNTTARLSGTESTLGKPAEVKLTPENANVGVKFEDVVELSGLISGETYRIRSYVYKDGIEEANMPIDTTVPSGSTNVVVELATLASGDKGTYTIKTVLETNGPGGWEEVGTHNDNLDLNSEKVILTEDEYSPQITNTTAIFDETRGSDSSIIEKKADGEINYTLKDEVGYKNLKPGVTYTIKSTLYKNGEAQTGEGKVVTKKVSRSTTDDEITGSEEIEFANVTETGRYTILTELLDENDTVVSKHNGRLNVRAESVVVTDGQELKTTVKAGDKSASENSPLMANAGEVTSFTDTIEYKDLSGGQTYEVTGTLKEIKDGKVVDENVTTATDTFKAESNGSGTWELKFKDLELEPGKTYVVFEKAVNIKDATDKAEHENPNDKAQTIVVSSVLGIKISKKVIGGDEVPGASMKLTGGPGNISETWTSTNTPEEFSVKAGDYVLTEVVAPAGLQKVTTEMKFSVDAQGEVELKTATVDNDGKITVESGNHIVLSDAPIKPSIVKQVNDGKTAKFSSVDDTVEFKLTSTVPYGAKSFKIKDTLPDPLIYVDDSIEVTIGGVDATTGDKSAAWTILGNEDIEVELSGPSGPSMINIADCYGKEVVVTFKCTIDPDADISKYNKIINVATVEVDGESTSSGSDGEATVIAPNDGPGEDEDSKSTKKVVKTSDDTDIATWIVMCMMSSLMLAYIYRRNRKQL